MEEREFILRDKKKKMKDELNSVVREKGSIAEKLEEERRRTQSLINSQENLQIAIDQKKQEVDRLTVEKRELRQDRESDMNKKQELEAK